MHTVADGKLHSYLKLGFLRAAWQPACCSRCPLSTRSSSLLPLLSLPPLHLPFIGFSLSAPAQRSQWGPVAGVRHTKLSWPRWAAAQGLVYVRLGGGGPLRFSAQTPLCWLLARVSVARTISHHGSECFLAAPVSDVWWGREAAPKWDRCDEGCWERGSTCKGECCPSS